MASRTWLLGCMFSVVVLSGTPNSHAQPERDPRYEPSALRLLDQVVRHYKELPAYSDKGKLYLSSEINGKKSNESTIMHVAFTRPDKLILRCGAIRFLCDGREASSVLDSSLAYVVDFPPKNWQMIPQSIARYPGGASILGGISGLPPTIILDLLNSDDPRKAILEETDGLCLENERADSNSPRQCLLIDQHQGPDIRLFVDRTTRLVMEMEMMLNPDQLFDRVPSGVVVNKITFGWVSGPISTEPLDSQLFAFKPPQGYKKVATWDRAIDIARQHDPQIGKPVPDFTLPVLAGPNSTKPLRLADLKGKVVVIVFWTSWSPPCFDQLAWVKSGLLDKYRERGVVMLSVNIDDDAAAVNEAQSRTVRILKEKGLALDQAPFSYVALDPVNSVGQALRLKTIPMTVILDRDGMVRSLFAGFKKSNQEPTPQLIEKLLEPAPAAAR